MTISGSGTLLKTSPGALVLSSGAGRVAMNMGAGGLIDIENGGIGNDNNNVQWGGNLASVNIASGAVLDIRRTEDVTIDALTGSGTVGNSYYSGGPNTLYVGAANGSGTFSGVIMGVGNASLDIYAPGTASACRPHRP